jgi:glycosyltransferase involved in cell wall biosynthesis
LRGTTPAKRTLTESGAAGGTAFVLNSLITFGPNPLPQLRETLQRAKPGECVWVIEPDALVFPSALPLTSLQHLLLDESEADRSDADEEHARAWALATGSRKTDEQIPLHPLSETVFRQCLDEICAKAARVESVWIDSNASSRFYVALLRKLDAQTPGVETHSASASAKPAGQSQGMMFILHENPFRAGAGGTEQAVLMRVEALALPEAYLVYPNAPREIQCARVQNGKVSEPQTFTFRLENARKPLQRAHAEVEDLVIWIARQFGLTRICVDHLMHWPLRLPQKLKHAGLDLAIFLHDYYTLNPSQNLYCELHNRRCFTEEDSVAPLNECVQHFLSVRQIEKDDLDADEFIAAYQREMKANLEAASTIFCPDDSVRDRIARVLKIDPKRFTVLPHGYAHEPITIREMKGPRIRVALIGALDSPIKGSRWLTRIFDDTPASPIDWHVFGRIDALFPPYKDGGATLTQHGAYARADLIPLLKQHEIDVALLPSVVDESFMLTLSEAVLAGVPVIAGDLGAQASRIKKDGLGWVMPVDTGLQLILFLADLAENPEKRNAVARNLLKYKHLTPEENAARFVEVFAPSGVQSHASSRWIQIAREYEETLRAAFHASRDERLALGEGMGVVDHFQGEWNRVGNEVEWKALSNDACARVRPQRFSRDKRHILFLDITSPFRDVLQVYFQTFAKQDWTEAQSIRRTLEKGRSKIWIELTDRLLYGPLRIDISTKPGTFQLHDLRLRAV